MRSLFRTFYAAAIGVLLLGAVVDSALAAQPFVSVPNGPPGGPPGTGAVHGCYEANRQLFGRYRFSFCLQRNGTFRVRGAAHCDGVISWGKHWDTIDVHVRRTACRNHVTWAQADMTCWPSGWASLRCIYKPTVRGYWDEHFTAHRH